MKQYFSKLWRFLLPVYKVNKADLKNQTIYLDAERLNYERGRKFYLDLFKFTATVIGLVITFLAFLNQYNKEAYNAQNSQFIELSKRVVDPNPSVAANAIVTLPLFSIDQTPWYLTGLSNENPYPYLDQIRNLIVEQLKMEAVKASNENKKDNIDAACRNALSQIARNIARKNRVFDLTYSEISGVNLKNVIFERTDLSNSNMVNTNLHGVKLSNSVMYETDFQGADLSNSDISDSSFFKDEKLSLIETAFNFHKIPQSYCKYRLQKYSDKIYEELFHTANLKRANLRNASLSSSQLAYVSLSGADLSDAKIFHSNLHCANLRGSNLKNAFLFSANLSGSDLSLSNLSNAHGMNVNFDDVDISGANLSGSDFGYINLSFKSDILVS